MNQAHNRLLSNAQKEAIGDRISTGHATRLTRQTSLTEEAPAIKKRDDRLFAPLGNDGEFYFPFQDVENTVGRIALREDHGPVLEFDTLAFRRQKIEQFTRS